MPISSKETYKIDYDKRHGVILEFIQRNRIRWKWNCEDMQFPLQSRATQENP